MDVKAGNGQADLARLANNYQPISGLFDEMRGVDGGLYDHWGGLIQNLADLGQEGINTRWDAAQRLIHENGITYNVYGDPEGMDRPWQLDAIPLVISPDDWATIEKGLIQRARLLNSVLADIYGPQRLIRDGHLPGSLIFGNRRFLRSCHGFVPNNGCYLDFYAADLGRSPDGRWWVLNDRTQAPSGVGYALENRIVARRTFSDIIRNEPVQRLSAFLRSMKDHLRSLAPHRDEPRVVLLTPGPFNETYFEHVYLARYMGFTLVEGADLAVRDNHVYMKTLSGLKQVDVILRRLDEDYCDPLELRDDSSIGVPGLVQAYRAGNVAIANPLGSGAVEAQGLMGFLPGLSQLFFSEDLIIPNVATWWCGQDDARAYVLEHLDELVAKPCFDGDTWPTGTGRPINCADLSPAEKDAMRARIMQRGHTFIGQESITLSTAPIWQGGTLVPAPISLRVFVTADGNNGYKVMPGGLTRFSREQDFRAITMQQGDGSKDTWVLTPDLVETVSQMTTSNGPVIIRRGGMDIPSRAAENLFWLGRYAERTEGVVRMLRAVIVRLTGDLGPMSDESQLQRVLDVLIQEAQAASGDDKEEEKVLAPMPGQPLDPRYTEGLRNNLNLLAGGANLVRDRLSLDAWRVINGLYQGTDWRHPSLGLEMGQALDKLDNMVSLLSAFSGMESENMTRGIGWAFLDMGRRTERGMHTAMLIRTLLEDGGASQDGTIELLLELCDSFMTYRARYLSTPQLAPALDLLLIDDSNPRAVAYQLEQLDDHMSLLPKDPLHAGLTPEQRLVRDLLSRTQLADARTLAGGPGALTLPHLTDLLDRYLEQLPELSSILARSFFTHAELTSARASHEDVPPVTGT